MESSDEPPSSLAPRGSRSAPVSWLLGVLWTLSNLGRLELLPVLRTWWPLSLVLWGVLELADLIVRRSRRS